MSYYDWLDENLETFFENVGIHIDYHGGLIAAHGDKCHCYRNDWEKAGIPFEHGVAIYLLTSVNPYADQVHETEEGWVDVKQWVMDNYPKFKPHLPPPENK